MHPDKRKELEYELRHETVAQHHQDSKPKMIGMFFYNVPAGKESEAAALDIKKTSSGKWAMKRYDKSGRSFNYRKNLADQKFGAGKRWEPQVKEDGVQTGTISQSSATDVTVANPDGTKTVVPVNSGLLSKDASGKLTLNKAAVKPGQPPAPTQQGANKSAFQPGQKVAINSSIEHESVDQPTSEPSVFDLFNSIDNLKRSNNGKFKSEKQRNFFMRHLDKINAAKRPVSSSWGSNGGIEKYAKYYVDDIGFTMVKSINPHNPDTSDDAGLVIWRRKPETINQESLNDILRIAGLK